MYIKRIKRVYEILFGWEPDDILFNQCLNNWCVITKINEFSRFQLIETLLKELSFSFSLMVIISGGIGHLEITFLCLVQ